MATLSKAQRELLQHLNNGGLLHFADTDYVIENANGVAVKTVSKRAVDGLYKMDRIAISDRRDGCYYVITNMGRAAIR